ncbi:ABC transporter permease [Candidatus Odyssella thessalonicensis]|uniref:ABC transporter permease n=1 Tax=Candidatus Odyssella thessalonicensis TaxID=84647 RepID=UPI000225C1F8|nr:ABC transporter permease [Candidatus Odyssella thessalonicensis]
MNIIQFTGAIELGLIYSLVAIGIFLSFRVLKFSDLTVGGSFPLGAAVTVSLISLEIDPFLATLAALAAGALAGWVTATLSIRFKIIDLIASIITMTALYSVNIRVMHGQSNLSILGQETLISKLKPTFAFLGGSYALIALLVLLVSGISILLYLFLSSHYGLALRATGNNARMARANGIADGRMIQVGLALSNALIALAGSIFAQENSFADVNINVGIIVVGLTGLILGETLLSSHRLFLQLFACLVGAIVNQLLFAVALNVGDIGLEPTDLNLITAVILAGAMILPTLRKGTQK